MDIEPDWGFVDDDGDMLQACEKAASRASREWDGVEYDDAFQEAVTWLAVHPKVQDGFWTGRYENAYHLADRIYINGLRDMCIRESYGGMTGLPHDRNDHVIPMREEFVEWSDE